MKTKLLLALLGFAAAVPCSSNADGNEAPLPLGRYQAFVSSEIRDKDDITEGSGVWLLDTATGQIAFCRHTSGLINIHETDDGITIAEVAGEHMVACTAWAVPKSGPWDKYQRQQQ